MLRALRHQPVPLALMAAAALLPGALRREVAALRRRHAGTVAFGARVPGPAA